MTESTQAQEISQNELDEALLPELSEDFFMFGEQKIQIKPLKVRYQKLFAKAFSPILQNIAMDLINNQLEIDSVRDGETIYRKKRIQEYSYGDWIGIAASLLDCDGAVEFLPRVVQILCHNDGKIITDEELDDSTMQADEMKAAIVLYCKKRGGLEKRVFDFFENVLPLVIEQVVEPVEELTAILATATKLKQDSMSTASSNQSAEATTTT